eukprot:951578-Prymnesium_polylepis.1
MRVSVRAVRSDGSSVPLRLAVTDGALVANLIEQASSRAHKQPGFSGVAFTILRVGSIDGDILDPEDALADLVDPDDPLFLMTVD